MAKATPGTMISLDVAAQLIMVTPRWVQKLSKDGWIPKADRGQYSLIGVVQGYINYLKDQARGATANESENRVRDAKAREIEIRIAQKEGSLVDVNEMYDLIDVAMGMLRVDLDGLPARISRNMEMRTKIEGELRDILQRASDRFRKSAEEDVEA